ncbi:MAG TPA: hypothetical protein VH062_09725 [Polyangiaceae bacterium]|nr:hypothetical protein [Polyangiaceae bacterium]
MSGLHSVALLSICLITVGCGTDVTVNRTPAYVPGAVTLSVFGVFKNGRMDPAAWDEWAPTIAAAVGSATCPAAFDDHMEKSVPALFSELDESTQQDGITDELLDRAAASARGDALLVIETFGGATLSRKRGSADATPAPPPAPTSPPAGRHRGRGGMRGAPAQSASPEPPRDALDVSVGVYSIREHEVTASVRLHTDGTASPDTLRELSAKLRETLHGARCAGWAWQEDGPRVAK